MIPRNLETQPLGHNAPLNSLEKGVAGFGVKSIWFASGVRMSAGRTVRIVRSAPKGRKAVIHCDLRQGQLCGTFRTFAGAAIADAAYVCDRGTMAVATQRVSSIRSFIGVDLAGTEIVFSLHFA